MLTTNNSNPTTNFNIRTCGINPNHWYVVARSNEVKNKPLGITLWKQKIVLFRDETGNICALEDRCPHRQVKLSSGKLINNQLECVYHGWKFLSTGVCISVPYLTAKQKLPSCKIRTYPVKELDGFIWLFPGKNDPESIAPLGIPEWEHLNYIATVSLIECPGHYSYLIENLMDMYHGHLHDNYQAWAAASLEKIEVKENRIDAHYQAQSYYKIDKIWSISQLFFPALRRLHPEPLNVSYIYPHWLSTLGNDFKIYCLFCPVNETYTRAYLIHFTSLNAFWRLHKLPIWFRKFIKNSLFGSAQKLLDGLVEQDIAMIAEEQQAYLENPQLRNYELNPVISRVQKLIQTFSLSDSGR
ncbi:aromatic ring-hydroxylating dioxygenase subunit alpha [Oscillatoria salina]|uniref:aromatic ring-hydroxylating dioxygenase subunit alpha n=1 Tax=Oscillatoria salina TaxID=331517 RepID=UPI001CD00A1D|nr:aromatic ring-hydroxylating dioxygenase subunit alpha [Oscillatoria salina]MBZ8178521.1 aromatic ring-hydroxylating dioxygenase subunit alpha [Oscillatoria salina IIICB1]